MKKAIIVGATGFIGSWLLDELLQNQVEVTVLKRPSEKFHRKIEEDRIKVIEYESGKILDCRNKLDSQYDTFYYIAWKGVAPEIKNDIRSQLDNISYTVDAFYLCNYLNCNFFITPGSTAEYRKNQSFINETSLPHVTDLYGATKVAVHYILQGLSLQLNQKFIWAIIPSAYGERRIDNNIITYSIRTLLNKERPVYGPLNQIWDCVYMKDVANALYLMGKHGKKSRIYGIGSGSPRLLYNYITEIRDFIDPSLPLGIGELPSDGKRPTCGCLDIAPLVTDTGYQPSFSFEEGIQRTIRYFKEQG